MFPLQIAEDFKKIDKDVENVSYLDLIRRKNELKNTLVVSFTWYVTGREHCMV